MGTIALNTATGAWTFADAAALDGLGAGVSEVLALTAEVEDDAGASVTKAFTITLNGVDDAAVVTVTDADGDGSALTFAVTATDSTAAAIDIATITITDPDTTYVIGDFGAVMVGGAADTRFEIAAGANANEFILRIKHHRALPLMLIHRQATPLSCR